MGCFRDVFERDPRLPWELHVPETQDSACLQSVTPLGRMATNCGRQNNSPKDVHILIHRACDCITLHGRRDFVDVVKLRTLRWGDCPGSFEWAQFIHKCSHKREAGRSDSEKEM